MIVYKKFNIESARSLPHVSKKHPCYQIHGHSFEIIIKVIPPSEKKIKENRMAEIKKQIVQNFSTENLLKKTD